MTELQPSIALDRLTYSIHANRCILMLGPDAITESVDGQDVPVLRLFGDELRRQLPPEPSVDADFNPAQVAQIYKDKDRFDDVGLRSAAEMFFKRRRDTTTPKLRDLAQLPFNLVIDTTPLNQMERAFLEAGKDPVEDWYHKKCGVPRQLGSDPTPSRPLVYHIFGSIKEGAESLVLAENDFIEMLVAAIKGDPGLPERLNNAFSNDRIMLFLGFGVRHFSLRILLRVLNSSVPTSRSIALEQFEESRDNRSVRRTKLFVQQGHKIDFIDMDLGDFTRELRRRYLERYGDPKASQASTPQLGGGALEPPHVFLSYCHEDKAEAERIKAELKRRGIKVWFDSESLRAGQDWVDAIERVVMDEIDGFITLNSPTLVSKTDGYVNAEIKHALRRAQMVQGIGFVYPVLIDGARPRTEFSRLEAVDGTREDGLDKLARDIKRDHQQRKKTLK